MKWIGMALSQWPRGSAGKPSSKDRRRANVEGRLNRRRTAAASHGHRLAHSRDGWSCLTCGRSSTTWNGAKKLALSSCRGHTANRVGAQGTDPAAHILWAAEAERSDVGPLPPDVIWCGRCGAYSSARVYNLARECRGVPEKSARTRLAAFNLGTHPTSRHRLAPPVRLTDHVLAALAQGAEQRRAAFNLLLRGDARADEHEADDDRRVHEVAVSSPRGPEAKRTCVRAASNPMSSRDFIQTYARGTSGTMATRASSLMATMTTTFSGTASAWMMRRTGCQPPNDSAPAPRSQSMEAPTAIGLATAPTTRR